MTGEATPEYVFNPHVINRVQSLLPNVKLVVMLRNPADRAYSHFHHSTRYGNETLDFESALDAEDNRIGGEIEKMWKDPFYRSPTLAKFSYKYRGIYLDQLKPWIAAFGRERIKVIRSEDFYSDPESVYEETLTFLGLRNWKLKIYKNRNPASYQRVKPETRDRLMKYFEPHNQRLYDFFDRDFGWK